MKIQVLALCVTIAALLRSILVLVDFSLLPIDAIGIISALSGKKNNQKGRKIKGFFLGFHDPISFVNVIYQMARGTAEVGDPMSPSPMPLTPALSVCFGGPACRGRDMWLLCGVYGLKIVSLSCSI